VRGAVWVVATVAAVVATSARADRQAIAPGLGSQTAVAIDSGANGICDTAVRRNDDIQVLAPGQGTPFAVAIECGRDRLVSTPPAGDDRPLISVGGECGGPNADAIDAGPNGVVESAAAGDDEQVLPIGTSTPNTPCVRTGANGLADTADPVGGDDVRLIAVGRAEANAPVIRCGANEIAESFANNTAAGDDVQLVAVGDGCPNPQTAIVDAGVNGIAETRAQGAELVISTARTGRMVIPRRRNTVSRRIRVAVVNLEFGAGAPPARTVTLSADNGSCPDGIMTEIDADARTPGVQAQAAVPVRRRIKGSVVVTFEAGDVTSVARDIPFRCQLTITATAADTAPAADDAINTANNTARVEIEIADRNDL